MENFQEIAKILPVVDSDNFMYPHRNFPHKCDRCNIPLSRNIQSSFKLNKKKGDVLGTYDGYRFVSKKFKDFCEQNNFSNLSFEKLPNDPDFFVFTSNNIVELDSKRRNTEFENFCDVCNRFMSVTGAIPNFFKNKDQIINNTIYKSKIKFGNGYGLAPIFIINLEVYKMIKKEKFQIYFGKNHTIYI